VIIAILQARVTSSRLPGKVLAPILGQPMLFRQIERVRRSREIEGLVVATSTDPTDDPLAAQCASHNIEVCRGSLDDVLDRFLAAAQPHNPDAVVRLTGDCPLTDWTVIDRCVALFKRGSYDYVSNVDPPTFPDGLDVEVVSYKALTTAARLAQLPSEREHVTSWIRNRGAEYPSATLTQVTDLSALRWTVDEPADFEFVRQVYEALYPSDPQFGTAEILALIERRPELARINSHIARNMGLAKSLEADRLHDAERGGNRV
jgi:spore coat polysaccharide biosynthesis protein SpsF (cytidylyltransferase family)